MRYEWSQCANRRAHLPHTFVTETVTTICEGVTALQSLRLPHGDPNEVTD